MTQQEQLNALEKRIAEEQRTSPLARSATQLVMGEGNPSADIVFIGEAPGKKEDETGLPFVGASGKLLNEMLASIALERKDVYITNIVKYRPPENRDPTPQEKSEFREYLRRQLAIIDPTLIVTLGRHSGMEFHPSLKISRDHGQTLKINGQLYLFLYHPAAALYNGSQRQVLLDDFSKIPHILELELNNK